MLYYIRSTDITFESDTDFIDEENIVIGEIQEGESVEIALTITNNTSSEVTLELGAMGGLLGYDLTLLEGQNKVVIENKTGADLIISKLGTGGLVAINTEGTLYDASDTTQEIREYRYSGATVDNYVIFNDDDDATIEDNELWRIIGVFKNSDGKWNVKLMRNKLFQSSELPTNYTYNGIKYKVKFTSFYVFWNSSTSSNSYADTDWTNSGLQYYLNTNQDTTGVVGYYSTFNDKAKVLIDENYTYYLGNVGAYSSDQDTTISAYVSERDANNVHSGNQDTWQGKIALLYPSDYGYSAQSTYWNNQTLFNYENGAMDTSWIYKTANIGGYGEWFISATTHNSSGVSFLDENGGIYWHYTSDSSWGFYTARPVLNLIAEAMIDIEHEGTKNDPFIVIE